jgi:hypothetical protein
MGGSIAVIVHCEGGHVLVPDYRTAIALDKEGKEIRKFEGAEDHHANFVKAVRSRKHEELHGDILEGHLSSALCHTGNISYLLGKQHPPDQIQERIQNDSFLSEACDRAYEHLQANQVDLTLTPATLGVPLRMDPVKERFLDNSAANELLTRQYREPFVVPAKV